MIVSFPGGSGGNWLQAVFENEHMAEPKVNFHNRSLNKLSTKFIHSLDPSEFDYLLSGSYYFNFFVNVVYKYFHYEKNFTQSSSYKDSYTGCVNTARYLCEFETIKNLIFFNFDDLIHNDSKFYHCIKSAKPSLSLSYNEFLHKKNLFFNTMVNTQDVYENFDNQLWVTFVLGQLMHHGIVPGDFSIYEKENQARATEFAKTHYRTCKLIQVHHFNTNVFLPNLL